ncbi:hypothetical protein EPN18_04405 [bacterium]|nr:MAG: hypothetical protein EPN18_04405 [bacterium]
MILQWMPLFITGAALESTTQIFLKKGALEHSSHDGLKYYFKLLKNKWVLTGIGLYLIEMVIWIILLSVIPLSVAFPITGVQKIMIILFSFLVLKEKISRVEWFSIGITALGISIISI